MRSALSLSAPPLLLLLLLLQPPPSLSEDGPGHADADPAGAGPADSSPTDAGPVVAGLADPDPAGAGPSDPDPAGAGPAIPKPSDPDPTGAGPADPKPSDPDPTGAGPAIPKPSDPDPAGAGPAIPKPSDPDPTGAGPADPKPSDPDPAGAGPAIPKPSDPDPAGAGPADPKPSDPDPAGAGPAIPKPSDPDPAGAGPADPKPSDPDPAGAGPAIPKPSDPDPAGAGPSDPDPAGAGPADPKPSDPDPTGAGPADPHPAGAVPTGAGPEPTASAVSRKPSENLPSTGERVHSTTAQQSTAAAPSGREESAAAGSPVTTDHARKGTPGSGEEATLPPTAKGGGQATPQPPLLVNTSDAITTLLPVATPTSTQHAPGPVPSKLPGSFTPQGAPTALVTPVTFKGSQQTSSKMPATTETTWSETVQHTGSSSGPVGTMSSNPQVTCETSEEVDETILFLNFTETRSCEGNRLDTQLATLLCRAAKPTFNPTRDQCHVQLASILKGQAVGVRNISIKTTLLPEDIYKLLKDNWDDLKEMGVSHMQLGQQGPPEPMEDRFSMPLIITIVCMASFLLLVAALYGCCHQRLSQRKDQQRLTEELQTVENGYHDNPTLEVMETSSDMQEKKVVNLNGELGDSWIVPLDNLIKDDLDEEEDTHL